jgi:polyphosphate kinase 2
MNKKTYKKELKRIQHEMVQLQHHVKDKGLKVIVVLEGRDAAGKGGAIRKLTQRLNPNHYRVVAKGKPSPDEDKQWYFQRWVKEVPSEGQIVFFDRSWYTRAVVESVMGFATKSQVTSFLKDVPSFEKTLIRQGVIILKYWLSITQSTQEKRFHDRLNDITKQWKLSPMDLESRNKWDEYTTAKSRMLKRTSTSHCPWVIIDANNKDRTRIDLMTHIVSQFKFEHKELTPKTLPPVFINKGKDTSFDKLKYTAPTQGK